MQPWPALQPYARLVTLPDGLRLHCYDSSTPASPVFLLIHGLGDEADTWRHIFPALAAHGRVIALDLPGFGRSDKLKTAYTIHYYCRVVLALMDQLQLEGVTLAGHSLGAVIAHQLALENPPRVSRLALLSGCLVASFTRLNLGA
jgi:pimeloyl-ACP methyl ester carboxylesterase